MSEKTGIYDIIPRRGLQCAAVYINDMDMLMEHCPCENEIEDFLFDILTDLAHDHGYGYVDTFQKAFKMCTMVMLKKGVSQDDAIRPGITEMLISFGTWEYDGTTNAKIEELCSFIFENMSSYVIVECLQDVVVNNPELQKIIYRSFLLHLWGNISQTYNEEYNYIIARISILLSYDNIFDECYPLLTEDQQRHVFMLSTKHNYIKGIQKLHNRTWNMLFSIGLHDEMGHNSNLMYNIVESSIGTEMD